ncbi:MAG: DUF2799 domain-containing protein [Sphingomonadaceae bacterium]
MKTTLRTLRPLLLALPLLLGGCQTTMQRIADCKVGDWTNIGRKDGVAGEVQNFAERKEFCDDHGNDNAKAGAAAASSYGAGWEQGNWDFWAQRGRTDGQQARLVSAYDGHVASPAVRNNATPLNRPAYEAGWLAGNADYWQGLGKREGTAGLPLQQKEINRQNAAAAALRFDETAYASGWQVGNHTFWQDAGFNDAHNGVPDTELKNRATAARSAGVLVQEEAYRSAWQAEIINYWRNLGTQDAVSGKDFAVRKREALQKGLKLYESDYRQAWEARLVEHWRAAGASDGYGKPFLLDERIANAARDGVFVIPRTRDVYTDAWDEQNTRYCTPDNAFDLGRRAAGMAIDVCRAELRNQLKRALLSGRDYEEASRRYNQSLADANDTDARLRDGHRRLSRLDNEIRSALGSKDRVVNEETQKQDRRRDQERRELVDYLQRLERQLDDARRWVHRHQQQMEQLRRDIYVN